LNTFQIRIYCLGIRAGHLQLYLSHVFRHNIQATSAASTGLPGPCCELVVFHLKVWANVLTAGFYAQLCLQSPGDLRGFLLLQAGATDVQQRQAGHLDVVVLLVKLVPTISIHTHTYERIWNTHAAHMSLFRALAPRDGQKQTHDVIFNDWLSANILFLLDYQNIIGILLSSWQPNLYVYIALATVTTMVRSTSVIFWSVLVPFHFYHSANKILFLKQALIAGYTCSIFSSSICKLLSSIDLKNSACRQCF